LKLARPGASPIFKPLVNLAKKPTRQLMQRLFMIMQINCWNECTLYFRYMFSLWRLTACLEMPSSAATSLFVEPSQRAIVIVVSLTVSNFLAWCSISTPKASRQPKSLDRPSSASSAAFGSWLSPLMTFTAQTI